MNVDQLQMMDMIQQLGTGAMIAVVILLIVLSLPPVFILFSRRVKGGNKLLWFILTSAFSWLAYVVYLIVVPKEPRSPDKT